MPTTIDVPPDLKAVTQTCITSGRYSDTNNDIRTARRMISFIFFRAARSRLTLFCLILLVGSTFSSVSGAQSPHKALEVIDRILPAVELLTRMSEDQAPSRNDVFNALLVSCNTYDDISSDGKYQETIEWLLDNWDEHFFADEIQINLKQGAGFESFLGAEREILQSIGLSQSAWSRMEALFVEYRYDIVDFDPNRVEMRFFSFRERPEICSQIGDIRQILANAVSSNQQEEIMHGRRHEIIGKIAACFLGAFAVAGDVPAFASGLWGLAVTSTSFGIFFAQVFCPSFEEFRSVF